MADGLIQATNSKSIVSDVNIAFEYKRPNEGLHGILTAVGQSLQKFEYAEDTGTEAFRKDIATMEAGLKKLEAQEQKYSDELDKVLAEYADLKSQAADIDPVELYKARQAIRPAQEKAAEQQIEDAMHEKPFLIMLLGAKQETSRLLGEDAEERQVRQLIAHKRQEQHRNSISKRKRSDPER